MWWRAMGMDEGGIEMLCLQSEQRLWDFGGMVVSGITGIS